MIHHPVSFDHFDAALLADLPQDLAALRAQASEDGLLAVRRHDDHVGPGSTTSRALGFATLASGSFLIGLGGSAQGGTTFWLTVQRRNGRALGSPPP